MTIKKHYLRLVVLLSSLLLPVCVLADDKQMPGASETALLAMDPAAVVQADKSLAGTDQAGAKPAEAEQKNREEEEEVVEEGIVDPFEPMNRFFFNFNDKLYFWLLKPVANGYSFIVPEWGRVRVRNVFKNVKMPVRFVNSLLQLKIKGAARELAKFMVNTTVGVGGMFDIPWDTTESNTSDEDLGQTFGHYGIGSGFYLVLPVLGPSSLRDGVGRVGDAFLDPVNYITPLEDSIAVQAVDRVNDASLRIGEYEDFKEAALDPYLSMRDAYDQYRKGKIKEEGTAKSVPLY
jgi:phospholipid-binding lipoprotein MlaA